MARRNRRTWNVSLRVEDQLTTAYAADRLITQKRVESIIREALGKAFRAEEVERMFPSTISVRNVIVSDAGKDRSSES